MTRSEARALRLCVTVALAGLLLCTRRIGTDNRERLIGMALSLRHRLLGGWVGSGGSPPEHGERADVLVRGEWGRPGSARQIMQTWKNRQGDHGAEWLAHNPGWSYQFLSDSSALSFLRQVRSCPAAVSCAAAHTEIGRAGRPVAGARGGFRRAGAGRDEGRPAALGVAADLWRVLHRPGVIRSRLRFDLFEFWGGAGDYHAACAMTTYVCACMPACVRAART
jgi:hypothetical protein